MQRMSKQRKFVVGAGILLASLLSFGCGGDDDFNFNNYNNYNPNQLAPSWAGTYTSVVALDNNQSGLITLFVNNANQITGTLTVSNDQVQGRAGFPLALGTYSLNGSFDPSSGSFSLSGTLPLGAVSLQGVLPTATSPGNYTLNINGDVFSGSFAAGGNGGNNGGSNGGGTGDIYRGVASTNEIDFNAGGGFNGPNPTSLSLVSVLVNDNGENNLIGVTFSALSPSSDASFGFVVNSPNQPLAEQDYHLLNGSSNIGSTSSLLTFDIANPGTTKSVWTADPGTGGAGGVRVVDLDYAGRRLELEYEFTNVNPNSENPGTAAGTFDVSGHIIVTDLAPLPAQ